jgi:hypothetical protein
MVGRASRLKGWGVESRVMWLLNVWTREVAAGRNLNGGSFTMHRNVVGAACSAHVKDEKKSLSTP